MRHRACRALIGTVFTVVLYAAAVHAVVSQPTSLSAADAARETTIYRNDDLDLIVKTQQIKAARVEKVLNLLDIRPGMTVLDIGAGAGLATFSIARRLAGRGAVFATEIDPKLVELIAAESRRRGLRNVSSVLVHRNGVDSFYSKQRYDLILLYSVITSLRDRQKYFETMRGFLTKGGRLAIVDERPEIGEGFSRDDFADWEGFLAALEREPAASSFRRLVLTPAREVLVGDPHAESLFPGAVIFYLNLLMHNLDLLADFTSGLNFKKEVSFTPEEEDYAFWRLHRLKLAGVPDERNLEELPHVDVLRTALLNKLLIIQKFRPYFVWNGPHPYASKSRVRAWGLHTEGVPSLLRRAGYRLDTEHELIPFQALSIFTNGDRAGP